MRSLRTILMLATLLLALGGCRVVYKMDVNQGNLVDQEMVDQLKPGMTRRQVALIMGTPAVVSPFDDDRWSYTSSFSHRGRKAEVKTLTLVFEDDLLARIEGDYFPQRNAQLLEESRRFYPGGKIPTDEPSKKKRPSGG